MPRQPNARLPELHTLLVGSGPTFESLEQRLLLSGNELALIDAADSFNSVAAESVPIPNSLLLSTSKLGLPPDVRGGGIAWSDVDDSSDVQELIVGTNPADLSVPRGAGFDGVVQITIYRPDLGVALCTGTLLSTGRHILTAAHCLADDFGQLIATGVEVSFHMPSPIGDVLIGATGFEVHTNYNGDVLNGADIAIIELAADAPAGAERFDIYRGTNDIGQEGLKVGYGRTGTGVAGDIFAAGVKRAGSNVYDATADMFEFFFGTGTVADHTQLAFDFDSGEISNDAFGFFFGIGDVGLGSQTEVNSAPGDSGGPTFLDVGGSLQIGGVTSYGFGGVLTDVDAVTNSSFGEFSADTRVSHYAGWIDSVIGGVPLIGPTVTQFNPSGVVNDQDVKQLVANFSEDLATGPAQNTANFVLLEAGVNGTFEGGGGDDVTIALSPVFDGFSTITLNVGSGLPLDPGQYQLTVSSNITDLDGVNLNSTTGVGGGSDFVHNFEIEGVAPFDADVILQTVDKGHYDFTGGHDSDERDYRVGKKVINVFSGGPGAQDQSYHWNNFFVWNLESIAETEIVTGAAIYIRNPADGFQGHASEQYALFDVTTPIDELRAGGQGLHPHFFDLGSGTPYGSTIVDASDNDSTVILRTDLEDQLTTALIDDINAHRGGLFAVGGRITSVSGNSLFDEFLFDNTHAGSTVTLRLITETLPGTPPTLTQVTPLSGGVEDLPLTITYDELLLATDVNDVDGDNISFRIESVLSGTLTKDGVPVEPVGARLNSGTLLSTGESLEWTPPQNANGLALPAFEVKAFDGTFHSATEIAVTIDVAAVNDTPVANDDAYAVETNEQIVVDAENGVLSNDTDIENATLTPSVVDAPIHGTLELASDGSFTYTPGPTFDGLDNFTYQVNDGGLDSNIAQVEVRGFSFGWAYGVQQVTNNSSVTDETTAITTDAEGNVYATGFFNDGTDFEPGDGETVLSTVGMQDIFVAKYSALGELDWVKGIGGLLDDHGQDIALDANGNVVIVGEYRHDTDFDPGAGEHILTGQYNKDHAFVLTLSASTGDFVSAVNIDGEGSAIAVTAADNGDVIVTGWFEDTADFDPDAVNTFEQTAAGFEDIFVWRLDENRNFIWAKQVGSTNYDMANEIELTSNDDIVITGGFRQWESAPADWNPGPDVFNLEFRGYTIDAFVLKLDGAGDFVWAKQYGGGRSDEASDLAVNSADEIYITGYLDTSFLSPTVDFGTPTNPIILKGQGAHDIFVAKLDANGDAIWAVSAGGDEDDNGYGITLDALETVHVTGGFRDTVDFNPSGQVVTLSSRGRDDVFVWNLDADAKLISIRQIGGDYDDRGLDIAIDNDGNTFTGGRYAIGADFNPRSPVYALDGDSTGAFVAKFTPFVESAVFSGRVWIDANGNGLQDAGEIGLAGVPVSIYDAGHDRVIGGGDDVAVRLVFTDNDGNYAAPGVETGFYYTRFGLPIGYSAVDQNVGDDDTIDSDPDPSSAMTEVQFVGLNGHDIDLGVNGHEPDFGFALNVGAPDRKDEATGTGTVVDDEGNIYVTGYFEGTVDFDPGPATAIVTSQTSQHTSFTPYDTFIARYSPAGALVWVKTIRTGSDVENKIALDHEGNLIVTGSLFQTQVDFDPGPGETILSGSDMFVTKFTPTGNFVWAKLYGNTSGSATPKSLAVNDSGEIALTGDFIGRIRFDLIELETSGGQQTDVFLAKLDTDGTGLWAQRYGGSSSDFGTGVDFDPSGNIVSTRRQGAYFITQVDADGNAIWQRTLSGGTSIYLAGVTTDSLGNVIAVGQFKQTVDFDLGSGVFEMSASTIDAFVLRMNSAGEFIWAKQLYDEFGTAASRGVSVDANDNIYVNGLFFQTADFDPGPGTFELTSAGDRDAFVWKLDATGELVFARSLGGVEEDDAIDFTVDSLGNAIVVGYFNGTVDFDTSTATYELTAIEARDMFLSKLAPPAAVTGLVWNDLNLDNLKDDDEPALAGVTVRLFDPINALVGDEDDQLIDELVTDTTGVFNFTNLHPGNYYVEFEAPEGMVFATQTDGVINGIQQFFDPRGRTGAAPTNTTTSDILQLTTGVVDASSAVGLVQSGTIGDRVWIDANGDGLQDLNEQGLGGLAIHLINPVDGVAGNADDLLIRSVTSDSEGNYVFADVIPGAYYLEVTLPGFVTLTTLHAGNEVLDSDVSPSTGQSEIFTLSAAQGDNTIDIGVQQVSTAAPTSVILDANSDTGVFDDDHITRLNNQDSDNRLSFIVDGTIAGATVTLFANGVAIGSTTATSGTTTVTTDSQSVLFSGVHAFIAKQTRTGFAPSDPTDGIDVTIDTTNPTVRSIQINDASSQRSLLTELHYRFTESVIADLTPSDFEVRNVTTDEVIDPANMAISFDAQSNTAVLTFPGLTGGSLIDGNYLITLHSSDVVDLAGNELNGLGPSPLLADHHKDVYRLFGDSDGNRKVDLTDLFRFRSTYLADSNAPNYDDRFDSNADGTISLIDLFKFRSNYLVELDPPAGVQNNLVQLHIEPETNSAAIAPPVSQAQLVAAWLSVQNSKYSSSDVGQRVYPWLDAVERTPLSALIAGPM